MMKRYIAIAAGSLIGWSMVTAEEPGRTDREAEAKRLYESGTSLYRAGRFADAIDATRRALELNRRLYPVDRFPDGHLQVSACLNNLGLFLGESGSLDQALPLLEQSLAMKRKLYPRAHAEVAVTISNLGRFRDAMGAIDEALRLYEEALAMRRELYPPAKYPDGHVELANGLFNMGFAWLRLSQWDKAQPYLDQALAMRLKLYPVSTHPAGHRHLAISHAALGRLHDRAGAKDRALKHLEEAVALNRRLYAPPRFPDGHPELAIALDDLGGVRLSSGDLKRAREIVGESCDMMRRLYPPSRYPAGVPELVRSISNFGVVLHFAGDEKGALERHMEALQMAQRLGEQTMATASEESGLTFARSQVVWRDAYLSLALSAPGREADAYQVVWNSKAVVTRVLERRHRAARAAGTGQSDRLARLRDVRQRMDKSLRFDAEGPARDRTLAALSVEQGKLERELAAALPELPRPTERDRLGPADLVRLLPPGTAFIDVLAFNRLVRGGRPDSIAGWHRELHYIAFILAPDRPVMRVALGEAGAIHRAIADWRAAIDARGPTAADAEARRLVWEPISRHLPVGTRRLYVAPDGALDRMPWVALPGSAPGRVLLDEYPDGMATVPHAAHLLAALKFPAPPAPAAGQVLAVGNIAYDPPGAAATERGYDRLPATVPELAAVRRLAPPRTLVALEDSTATPRRLVEELPRSTYAHIATHGFALERQLGAERLRQLRRIRDANEGEFLARPIAGLHPLAYVGLALAGANQPASSDVGSLSGLSILDLPLDGLNLCVLSACETGLGDVIAGEGTFGLTRAFHLAGCPNVVASLWKVSDAATAALLAKFYHELWVNKKPPLAALREAQLTIYRHPELIPDLAGERGAPRVKEALTVRKSATPQAARRADTKLWAAFVLSGAGR